MYNKTHFYYLKFLKAWYEFRTESFFIYPDKQSYYLYHNNDVSGEVV